MSIEEQNQKKLELNDELNSCKRKWNIVQANKNVWLFLSGRLKKGQNKSQTSSFYHFRKASCFMGLGLLFLLFKITIPVSIIFFSTSLYHLIKMGISIYCFIKLKKGINATERINARYLEKQQEIEKNEEKIYQQMDLLNDYFENKSTNYLFAKCIERTAANQSLDEDLVI